MLFGLLLGPQGAVLPAWAANISVAKPVPGAGYQQ